MDTYHILNFHEIFAENAFCLSQRLGIELVKDFKPETGHTYIIFGAHNQAATLHSIQVSNPYFKYIIINGEPPQSDVLRNKYYLSLMKNNIVFDYHPISSEYLKTLGIRVYGQYLFEFPEIKSTTEREIDILFVGSKNERREKIYNRLLERYPNKNIVFHMDWKHGNHEEMTKLLHRSKVVLNIPYYDSKILETHRTNKALSCGCEVVSLYSGDKATDDFYEKYIHMTHDFFEYFDTADMLPDLIEKKLPYSNLIGNFQDSIVHIKWILEQLSKN
jgi:hypothetical protein